MFPTAGRFWAATPDVPGEKLVFGYPLLRLTVLVECDTRAIVDTVPDARPDLISFTAALETAGEQVIAGVGIIIPVGHGLVGAIGEAVLANPVSGPRSRGKARTRHNPTSKYGPNAGTFPRTSLKYTINTNVMIMEEGLTARSKR